MRIWRANRKVGILRKGVLAATAAAAVAFMAIADGGLSPAQAQDDNEPLPRVPNLEVAAGYGLFPVTWGWVNRAVRHDARRRAEGEAVDTAVNILNTNSREATPAGLANGPKRPVRIFAVGTTQGDSVTDAVEVTPRAPLTTPTRTAGPLSSDAGYTTLNVAWNAAGTEEARGPWREAPSGSTWTEFRERQRPMTGC